MKSKKIIISMLLASSMITSNTYSWPWSKSLPQPTYKERVSTATGIIGRGTEFLWKRWKNFAKKYPEIAGTVIVGGIILSSRNKIIKGCDYVWDKTYGKATGTSKAHQQNERNQGIQIIKTKDIMGFDKLDPNAVEKEVKDLASLIEDRQAIKDALKNGEDTDGLTEESVAIAHWVLLEGPPQTGKSTSLKALAKKFGENTFIKFLRGPDLDDMFVGGSKDLINKIKKELKKNSSPDRAAVMIIDELDKALYGAHSKSHSGGSASSATKIAGMLQGLYDDIRDQKLNIFVFASTNHLDVIQKHTPAIADRFKAGTMHIGLPDKAKRKSLFRSISEKINLEIKHKEQFFEEKASETEGWNITDIENFLTNMKNKEVKKRIERLKQKRKNGNSDLTPKNFWEKVKRPFAKAMTFIKDSYSHLKTKTQPTTSSLIQSLIKKEQPKNEQIKINPYKYNYRMLDERDLYPEDNYRILDEIELYPEDNNYDGYNYNQDKYYNYN